MITRIRISGMTCENCRKHVQAVLATMNRVSSVEVDLANGQATVTHDDVAADELVRAVRDEGYSAMVEND